MFEKKEKTEEKGNEQNEAEFIDTLGKFRA